MKMADQEGCPGFISHRAVSFLLVVTAVPLMKKYRHESEAQKGVADEKKDACGKGGFMLLGILVLLFVGRGFSCC